MLTVDIKICNLKTKSIFFLFKEIQNIANFRIFKKTMNIQVGFTIKCNAIMKNILAFKVEKLSDRDLQSLFGHNLYGIFDGKLQFQAFIFNSQRF